MVKLSNQDVLKFARLAKLRLSDDEVDRYRSELSEILGYVEQLNNVDTTGLKPTYQVTGLTNVMRVDEVVDYGEPASELLKNAPATQNGQIKVRRVLG